MKKLYALLILLFIGLSLHAQPAYPVQVNVNLVPPYSLYLDDYAAGMRPRISVILLNRDMNYPSMAVRLRLTIKGNGFTLKSNDYAVSTPILLEPNVPYKLTPEEIAVYFSTQNLTASGMGSSAYQKDRKLPEGMLEFCFEAIEHHTNRSLSLQGCGTAWVSTQKPPLLSQPFNSEMVTYRDPLNLLFQWTPQHSGLANVEYQLIIKQLWDNGLKPEAAWAYSTEIFREIIKPTSMLYGAALPPLTPGMRYAWAVQAIAKDGLDEIRVFENNGLSEIRSFSLSDYCPPPIGLTAKTDNGKIVLDWTPLPEQLGFMVSYRDKNVADADWFYTKVAQPHITLYDVRQGHTYEYRIGTMCKPDKPIYGNTYSISIPAEDTTYSSNCGVLPKFDLSNTSPLPSLAPGDMFMAADFPVYVTQVTGENGTFSGEGFEVMGKIFSHAKIRVKWNNIFVNTDRRMIRGQLDAMYDAKNNQIANLDDIFEGGSLVGKVNQGITKADVDLSFMITNHTQFTYNPDKGELIISDGENSIILPINKDDLSGNTGASVFPITVKDKDGNLYKIEENPNATTDETGNKALTVTPIGKQGTPIPDGAVNYKEIATDKAIVTFEKGKGNYAFDTWQPYYSGITLIEPKYEKLGDGYVPFKLLPQGKTDVVSVRIEIKDKNINPNSVIFKTPKGTEFSYKYENGEYTINLTGGEAGDGQELYALYPGGTGYFNLGKLIVVSYLEQTYKVVAVAVNGAKVDKDAMSQKLNEIYQPTGITWSVAVDTFTYTGNTQFLEKGSGLLTAYPDAMKACNNAYAAAHNVDGETVYLFFFDQFGAGSKDRDADGFMPRSKQFGYLFTKGFTNSNELYTATAHELGHGIFTLKHPFEKDYGKRIPETDPLNLMCYGNGTYLAKWQWDIIHDQGIVVRVFERDDEAKKQVWLTTDESDYNIAGSDAILKYLLREEKEQLLQIIKRTNYTIEKNDEYSAMGLLMILFPTSVTIGDPKEAKYIIDNFIQICIYQSVASSHEKIMEMINKSSTFPQKNIEQLLDKVFERTCFTATLMDYFLTEYKNIYDFSKSLGNTEAVRQLLASNKISLTNAGLKNILFGMSNTQLKNWLINNGLTHSEAVAISSLKRGIIKNLPNNVAVKFDKLLSSLPSQNIKALINSVDDISLAAIAANSGNTLIKESKVIMPKMSTVVNILNFIQLVRTIKNDTDVTPADVLSYMPHAGVSLAGVLVKIVVDQYNKDIWGDIWEVAPDWSIIDDWEKKWRGKSGTPNEPLYMYYTDQDKKCNPYLLPTSIVIRNKTLAEKIFGYTPVYVDFDIQSRMLLISDKIYFKPYKQVKYLQ